MKMDKKLLLSVTTALLLPSFCACIPAPRTVSGPPISDAASLLSTIEERRSRIRTFRGLGRLSLMVQGEKQTSRAVWVGSQPGKLRVETLGVWGQPNLTFLLNELTFLLYTHQGHRCVTGKATTHNLLRLVSMPLRAEDLLALVSGQVPIVSYDYVRLGYSQKKNLWCLQLYKTWRRLVEKMWLDDRMQQPTEVEVFNGWGHLQYKIFFDQFQDVDGMVIPHSIMTADDDGIVLSLTIERFWLGVEVPDEAYSPHLPCDEVTRLDS